MLNGTEFTLKPKVFLAWRMKLYVLPGVKESIVKEVPG